MLKSNFALEKARGASIICICSFFSLFIKLNESDSIVEAPQTEDSVTYVADEEHYTEVFKRMTEVQHSLKIATANLKNFNVFVEADGGVETMRLCD